MNAKGACIMKKSLRRGKLPKHWVNLTSSSLNYNNLSALVVKFKHEGNTRTIWADRLIQLGYHVDKNLTQEEAQNHKVSGIWFNTIGGKLILLTGEDLERARALSD